MEELLAALLQVFLEQLFEIVINIFIYFGEYWLESRDEWVDFSGRPIQNSFACFVIGLMVGYLTLMIFSHSFISVPFLRMANLVYGPVVCGLITLLMARARYQDYPLHRGSYALFFTLGLVMIRFVYAEH